MWSFNLILTEIYLLIFLSVWTLHSIQIAHLRTNRQSTNQLRRALLFMRNELFCSRQIRHWAERIGLVPFCSWVRRLASKAAVPGSELKINADEWRSLVAWQPLIFLQFLLYSVELSVVDSLLRGCLVWATLIICFSKLSPSYLCILCKSWMVACLHKRLEHM